MDSVGFHRRIPEKFWALRPLQTVERNHARTNKTQRTPSSCKKNAQRHNGVRMRYRWTKPAKQKWLEHGRYSFQASQPGRILLFTRTACYFILYSLLAIDRHDRLLAYYSNCYSPVGEPGWRKPAPHTRRTGSAIGNAAQHRFGVRMDIVARTPTITGHDKPWEGVCPDINTTDVHCFSRALLVTLFCTAFYSLQASNLCSSDTATVRNLNGAIFQRIVLKQGL